MRRESSLRVVKRKRMKRNSEKVSLQSDPLLLSQMRTSPEIYSNRFGEKSSQTLFPLLNCLSVLLIFTSRKKKSVVKAIQQERANMSEVTTTKKRKADKSRWPGKAHSHTHTKKRTMKELHYIAIICASFSIVLKNMKSWNR